MERTHNLQRQATDKSLSGWINGFIDVVIFSGSLPATRVAVLEFDPVFLTTDRGAGRCCRLLVVDSAGTAACDLGPFDCFSRYVCHHRCRDPVRGGGQAICPVMGYGVDPRVPGIGRTERPQRP